MPNDVREAYWYIAEELGNPTAAERRISLIDAAIQSLKENPSRHSLVRDDFLASKGFRMRILKDEMAG